MAYPLLPREGDLVEGRYKVLRGNSMMLEVLDVQTGNLISKYYSLSNKDRYAQVHLPDFQHYQVEGINIEYKSTGLNFASVTLALLQEPQGEKVEGRMRTFKLEEKAKILGIRDAFEKGDQDVYCTVINAWGTEVLGDVRSLPKDPPILKLPEEMMDMICTYLDDKDIYSLRQVSSVFHKTFLPIHKLWRISKMDLHMDMRGSCMHIIRKNKSKLERVRYLSPGRGPRLDFVSGAYQAFLKSTKELEVQRDREIIFGGESHLGLLSVVKNSCTNLESLSFSEFFDRRRISELILANKGTLKELDISYKGLKGMNCNFDLASISYCSKLEYVQLECGVILNLESLATLKHNLKSLYLNKLKEPLKKDQLIWFGANLPNLKELEVEVVHNCFDINIGEVDAETIVSILDGIDFHLTIILRGCTDGKGKKGRKTISGRHKKYCGKASRIRKQVMRLLHGKGKSSEFKSIRTDFVHGNGTYKCSGLRFGRVKEAKNNGSGDVDDYSMNSSEDEEEDQVSDDSDSDNYADF